MGSTGGRGGGEGLIDLVLDRRRWGEVDFVGEESIDDDEEEDVVSRLL